jgi:Ca2+-binding EF-hand superfamily protein
VRTLYQRLMNRQPDEMDVREYARMARTGGFGAAVDEILSSPEYRRAFGDWDAPGYQRVQYCAGGQRQPIDAANDRTPNDRMRLRRMDDNHDGVVTRDEWRGSAQSFRLHDWNHDGVLSGDELRADAVREGRSIDDETFDRDDRFDNLDVNHDGRIEWREWHGSSEAFDSLDTNRDNVLSRAELDRNTGTIGTSGQLVTVSATDRWIDTGLDVRAGESIFFDANGSVQLSPDPNDVAGPDGSRTNRLAPDAPMRQRSAGALVARIGNSAPMFVGSRGSISRAPVSGRLFLTVNDDYLGDNSGQFRVSIEIR